jgi:hypothetical protein
LEKNIAQKINSSTGNMALQKYSPLEDKRFPPVIIISRKEGFSFSCFDGI